MGEQYLRCQSRDADLGFLENGSALKEGSVKSHRELRPDRLKGIEARCD
jgi:hypothetical protein